MVKTEFPRIKDSFGVRTPGRKFYTKIRFKALLRFFRFWEDWPRNVVLRDDRLMDFWDRVHSLGDRSGTHHGECLRRKGFFVFLAEFLGSAHLGWGIIIQKLLHLLVIAESSTTFNLIFEIRVVVARFQHVLKNFINFYTEIYTYNLESSRIIENALPELVDDVVAEGTQKFWRNESQLLQRDLESIVIVFLDVISGDESNNTEGQEDSGEHPKEQKQLSLTSYVNTCLEHFRCS